MVWAGARAWTSAVLQAVHIRHTLLVAAKISKQAKGSNAGNGHR